MGASKHVEIPFYRGTGRQRGGRCYYASYWGNRNLTLSKRIVAAARRVGADLLKFSAAKTAELVSGRKHFQTAAEIVGKRAEKTVRY